jgi:hypothetical protein
VSPDTHEIDRDLAALEADLKRLEAEYNMFFAGRLARPPWETRSRVDAAIKRLDRTVFTNYGDRFRLSTLQSRFSTFVDLWDRGLRAREEGRPGPFVQPKPAPSAPAPRRENRIVHVTTLSDPASEAEKLQDLYESLATARREAGQKAIPFEKFADLIRTQVSSLREKGTQEVAFRVAVKEGKVAFTAKALKGPNRTDGEREKREGEKGEGG